MASVLATEPRRGITTWRAPMGPTGEVAVGDRFVNHDVIPARDAGWTRLEAPPGAGMQRLCEVLGFVRSGRIEGLEEG